jgi:phenylalanyl-tRNA synthetase alpha chain
MDYVDPRIAKVSEELRSRLAQPEFTGDILRALELKALYAEIPTLQPDERAAFGKQLNQLKSELIELAEHRSNGSETLIPIDVTAPFDVNTSPEGRPQVLLAEHGSRHPLTTELEKVLDIFYRMGFTVQESRQIDDDYHMFGSLNFPEGHPARDDYDTFMTVETDKNNKPFIAPAHTSTMQNRVLRRYKDNLAQDKPIAVVLPGRVYRNEDLDARHEHTFNQFEGVYVDRGIHAGNLLATFKTFLSEYYQQAIEIKSQPFYFPFTEPSFELALSCPFCQKQGCNICSQTGWIELLGMGMIHPNVLREAGIDSNEFTGFAWGCGLERLVMMKYGIEDIRHFESAKLVFLRQFS